MSKTRHNFDMSWSHLSDILFSKEGDRDDETIMDLPGIAGHSRCPVSTPMIKCKKTAIK